MTEQERIEADGLMSENHHLRRIGDVLCEMVCKHLEGCRPDVAWVNEGYSLQDVVDAWKKATAE